MELLPCPMDHVRLHVPRPFGNPPSLLRLTPYQHVGLKKASDIIFARNAYFPSLIVRKGNSIIHSVPRTEEWQLGAWFNGRTEVSKTFDEGSIPSAPAT